MSGRYKNRDQKLYVYIHDTFFSTFHISFILEHVVNVDEHLAEIFLEERQPTEDELHVSALSMLPLLSTHLHKKNIFESRRPQKCSLFF